jgi:Flp pilus assembly protein TadB
MRIQASSQVVLCVLYMVVSMRISPNLENAMRFAASNISGALAWDLRRMLWDIQMQKYVSASDALSDYIAKWKSENEEFAEALRLIKDSTSQIQDRARNILDEALNVVLDGTKTRMKHYAQDLNMPVMIVHMMGIVLPVMGTIMAPLAAVFLSDMVRPEHFIIGYDIVLPIIIIWFINNILQKRPVTISQVDTSKHPGIPPKGTMLLGKKPLPVLPIAAIITIAIVAIPIIFFAQNPSLLLSGKGAHTITSLACSMLLIVGVSFGMAAYFILTNYQKMRIQKEIETIEGEFETALFQLGNRISSGTPTEVAIEKSMDDIKDLKIANLFMLTLRNMKTLGLTFEDALFNQKYGALRYYPSKLIENIMYAVVDTAKKGVRFASEGMLRIASYMKNIRETQEYIRDLLSETVSSMKFQAYFLTPLITGLIVSMSDIIVKVLTKLGEYLDGIGLDQELGIGDISKAFGNMETSTAPEVFQLIVGIYMVEVIIILAMFLTKINYGDNKPVQYYNTGMMLLIAVTIYFIVALTASSMFGDMIESALSSLGVT